VSNGVVEPAEGLGEEPELPAVRRLAPRPEVSEVEETLRARLEQRVELGGQRNIPEKVAGVDEEREPRRLPDLREDSVGTNGRKVSRRLLARSRTTVKAGDEQLRDAAREIMAR
jgi:hypothetical protein